MCIALDMFQVWSSEKVRASFNPSQYDVSCIISELLLNSYYNNKQKYGTSRFAVKTTIEQHESMTMQHSNNIGS